MIKQPSDFSAAIPFLWENDYPLPWFMTRWEKLAFVSMVERLKPSVAIEIGNASGGSLQVLSKNCAKVYALDYDAAVHEKLKSKFSNVSFHTGDSKAILPALLKQISDRGERLEFILIDGDHSTSGVRGDINAILHNYKPITTCYIIFHDSFNPVCRKGIVDADWENCPYIHGVDIDFLPGYVFAEDNAYERKGLWFGWSMAIMKPEARSGKLQVQQSLEPTYKAMFKASRNNTLTYRIMSLFKNRYK